MELIEAIYNNKNVYLKGFNVDGTMMYVDIHTGLVITNFQNPQIMRPVTRNMFFDKINNCKLPEII